MNKIKRGYIFIMVLFLAGCARYRSINEDISESKELEEDISINADIKDDFMEQPVASEYENEEFIPEWIQQFTILGDKSETIYLGGNHNSEFFTVHDNKILFPECNIIIVASDTFGRGKEIIYNKTDKVLDIINILENTELLSESESINPDAKLLGTKMDIILLTVKGEYLLVEISVFDDNRVYIDIISENSNGLTSQFINSKDLAELIKETTMFKIIDFQQIDKFQNVKIIKDNESLYEFSESEINQIETILKEIYKEVDMCSGPFDIEILIETNQQVVNMRWSNDGCNILAVEGKCYELGEEDANWLNEIIKTSSK